MANNITYPPAEINNYIKHIIYINLDKRANRKTQIEEQLSVFDKDKIVRISAVANETNPKAGATKSHIKALEYAKEHNWPNVLILEDDAIWGNIDKSYEVFKMLIQKPFDVLMLGGTMKSFDGDYRVHQAFCVSSYIVNNTYYDKAINTLKTGLNNNSTSPPDLIYVKQLQPHDKWFIVNPALMIQGAGYSNAEKQNVNYTGLFSGGKKKNRKKTRKSNSFTRTRLSSRKQ